MTEAPERPFGLRAAAARRGLLGYGAIFALAAGVGILAGLGALLFRYAETAIRGFAVGGSESLRDAVVQFPWWQRLLFPAVGILIAAFLARQFLGRRGPTLDVMEVVVLRRGAMGLRDELLRVLAALSVMGTGGSVGPEGPVVELGAAVGSAVAGRTRERRRTVSLLASCGAAGGLAAAFNAPIGASIFVLEILIGRLSVDRFAPVIVASVAAVTVSQAAYGDRPVFQVGDIALQHAWELLPVILLGIAGAAVGATFLRLLEGTKEAFARRKWVFWQRALAGGVAVGAMGMFFPEVMGDGFETLNLMLAAEVSFFTLLFLLPLKMFATSATLGGGGMGGVFAPTLFIGAALGGLVGLAVDHVMPGGASHAGAYSLIGMAALVGATLHAPATAILLVFELSRDYSLVPPLMLATIIATVLARRLHPWSLYTQRLRRKGVRSPGDRGELVLAATSVAEVLEPAPSCVPAGASLDEVVVLLEREHRGEIYVVDAGGHLLGWIRSEDLAGVSVESLRDVAVAGDLARPPARVVSSTALTDALELLDRHDIEEIPVVASEERPLLTGLVTRRGILRRIRSGE